MTNFFDTMQGKRITAHQRALDIQFDAALMRELREVISPWPVIDTVTEVIIGAVPAIPQIVTITVVDGNGHQHTRAREIQDAFAEALGYAMRAGWNVWAHNNVPMTFRRPFAEMMEAAPVEVTA
jgi:hypothetical protein